MLGIIPVFLIVLFAGCADPQFIRNMRVSNSAWRQPTPVMQFQQPVYQQAQQRGPVVCLDHGGGMVTCH